MGLNFKKILTSFLFALLLVPAILSAADMSFKGKEIVNINKADAPTFAAYLKDIGANKAKAIVDWRRKNGKFKAIDDIKNVPGIGDATYKSIRRNISTSRGKSSAPKGYVMDRSSGKTVTRRGSTGSSSTSRSTNSSSSSSSNRSGTSSTRRSTSSSSSSLRRSGSSSSTSSSSNSNSGKKKKKKKKKKKNKK